MTSQQPSAGERREQGGQYLPTLDGWRALAILAVIISHGRETLFGPGGLWPHKSLESASAYGRLGVDLFFAISGFLITTRLVSEAGRNGRFSLSRFYVRRVFRILPPYMLYLAVIAAAGAMGQLPILKREVLDCLLFIRNYTMFAEGTYTNHFWSLAVEEHFYLLWPLLLLLAGPIRSRFMLPAIALGIHFWRAADVRYHLFARLLPDAGMAFRTDTRLDGLLWGCEAALLMPLLARLRQVHWLAWTGLLVSVSIVAVVARKAPMLQLWLAILFPLLITSTVLFPGTIGGRLLELPAVRWIGRMSYSLYIWQTLFLQSPPGHTPFFGMLWLKLWPFNLMGTLGVASLSFFCVERPLVRMGHRLTARRLDPANTAAFGEPENQEYQSCASHPQAEHPNDMVAS